MEFFTISNIFCALATDLLFVEEPEPTSKLKKKFFSSHLRHLFVKMHLMTDTGDFAVHIPKKWRRKKCNWRWFHIWVILRSQHFIGRENNAWNESGKNP